MSPALSSPGLPLTLFIVQLGSVNEGLTKADLSTRLFALALFFADINERNRVNDQGRIEDLTQLLDDLRIRLDDGYTFTKEQMVRAYRPSKRPSSYYP
jgi:hypothetical protein